jgi:hypothetical protein
MWCCVDPGLTDVSEERIASIFRVEESASGEPASAGGCRLSYQSERTSYIRRGTEGGKNVVFGEDRMSRKMKQTVRVRHKELLLMGNDSRQIEKEKRRKKGGGQKLYRRV